MSTVYLRPELAEQMASQLLNPGVLDEGLRSGLFLSGMRRTGKTTFLRHDLIPVLEAKGALVIYVDLWSDTLVSPSKLLHNELKHTLIQLQSAGSGMLQRLKQLKGAEVSVMGFSFSFNIDHIGQAEGPTLAEVLTSLVEQARTDVVLVVDEVQQAMTTEDGRQMLFALKAARDAINPRPGTPGHFLFIGTGSHRAQVSELTAKRNQAFSGAVSLSFPLLDEGYVSFLLARLAEQGEDTLPSLAVANQAFQLLGHRPEEMLKALRQLLSTLKTQGGDPDALLPVIAGTLRSMAADMELMKLEQLGELAKAVFARIAERDDGAKGLFSADAAAGYANRLGREVKVEEIQPVLNVMVAENLVMRTGHGVYSVADPFVQEIWRERQDLLW